MKHDVTGYVLDQDIIGFRPEAPNTPVVIHPGGVPVYVAECEWLNFIELLIDDELPFEMRTTWREYAKVSKRDMAVLHVSYVVVDHPIYGSFTLKREYDVMPQGRPSGLCTELNLVMSLHPPLEGS